MGKAIRALGIAIVSLSASAAHSADFADGASVKNTDGCHGLKAALNLQYGAPAKGDPFLLMIATQMNHDVEEAIRTAPQNIKDLIEAANQHLLSGATATAADSALKAYFGKALASWDNRLSCPDGMAVLGGPAPADRYCAKMGAKPLVVARGSHPRSSGNPNYKPGIMTQAWVSTSGLIVQAWLSGLQDATPGRVTYAMSMTAQNLSVDSLAQLLEVEVREQRTLTPRQASAVSAPRIWRPMIKDVQAEIEAGLRSKGCLESRSVAGSTPGNSAGANEEEPRPAITSAPDASGHRMVDPNL